MVFRVWGLGIQLYRKGKTMAKERKLAELLEEAKRIQAEIEAKKGERLKEIEDELRELGYTAVPIGQKPKAATATTKGKLDREEARKWLEATLKNGPKEKTALQKAYREKFEGNRLRIDGWQDLLKEDAKGMIVLK